MIIRQQHGTSFDQNILLAKVKFFMSYVNVKLSVLHVTVQESKEQIQSKACIVIYRRSRTAICITNASLLVFCKKPCYIYLWVDSLAVK